MKTTATATSLTTIFLWVTIFELYLNETADATGGMRQRNSSVPIRQLIQRSRLSSLLAKRRNSTVGEDNGDCAVCDPAACNDRLLHESEDLYCMKSINEETEIEISECVNEEELHSHMQNHSHFDEREGCESDHTWELCWCSAYRLPKIRRTKVKSRMWKIQNGLQEKRLKSMLPNSASTFNKFYNNNFNYMFIFITGIYLCLSNLFLYFSFL